MSPFRVRTRLLFFSSSCSFVDRIWSSFGLAYVPRTACRGVETSS